MKGLATLIKLGKRKLDELRRQMVVLENQKAQLEELAASLRAELFREMEAANQSEGVHNYFANFAKRIRIRQEKVAREIMQLNMEIEKLANEIAIAFADLKKYEIAQENEKQRVRAEAARKETIEMDEIATQQHERNSEHQ